MPSKRLSAFIALGLAICATAAPASTSVSTAPEPTATVAYASDDPNTVLWQENDQIIPEPIRGSLGASILGPQNIPLELQSSSLLAPPTTDHGSV